MDELVTFLSKLARDGDVLNRAHEKIMELTRASTGTYLRIEHVGGNRYHLYMVKNGGLKPKTHWANKAVVWENKTRGEIRERCEKALRA